MDGRGDETADGPPPDPWARDRAQRARRDRRAIVLATVAAVVLGVPTVLLATGLVRTVADVELGDGAGPTASERSEEPRDGEGQDVEVPTLDLDGLSGTDAELGRLLTDVDRSERAMLAAQEAIAEAFVAAGPDGDADDVLAAVGEAGGDGQRELQELRSDVARPVDDATAREVRDRYLSHLDAWVRYLVAVEDDPELLLRPDGEAVHLLAIDTTGDAFAQHLREELPDDLAPEVAEVAQAIADRGFPERAPGDRDTV